MVPAGAQREPRLFIVGSGVVDRVITALRARRSRGGRVEVQIDGQRAFDLPLPLAAGLAVGQRLAEQEVEALRQRAEEEAAYQRALKRVSWRPRSEEEVRRALARHGVAVPVQDVVLQRLREAGLLDDRRFAQAWVENQQTFRPRSRRALRRELAAKGVPREIAEAALAGLDEEAAALEAAAKAARRLRGLPAEAFRRRLGAALARRGFDSDVIHSVVARLWREAAEPVEESEDAKWNSLG